jgi:uncharacterized protein (TIGR03435 family)
LQAVAAVLLFACSVVAQAPAFEAISITLANSGAPGNMRMRALSNGDVVATAVPLPLLLHYAYDVPINPSPRVVGVPEWPQRFDIEAKAPPNAIPSGLSERDRQTRLQGMIRGLLADRFTLVMRVEQKTMPVYALTVANGGPHLQRSAIAERDCVIDTGNAEGCHNFRMGRGHPLRANAVTMDDLVQYIENWTDLPVVNRTGITGLFAVETDGWNPMRLPPPPPGNAPLARYDDLPTIFTVLRGLGLKLTQQMGTVPIYTVEHIERPAGD